MSEVSNMKVEKGIHSMLGASSYYRWSVCKGSPQFISKLPAHAFRTSVAAAQGTAAHEVGAAALKNKIAVDKFENITVNVEGMDFKVDVEMVNGLKEYTGLVYRLLEQYKEYGAYLLVEIGLKSEFHEKAFGTSDAVIVVPGLKIIVIDLKYGAGKVVEPTTPQTKYYGYLVLENLSLEVLKGISEIELIIAQPRIPHPKGTIRAHTMTIAELEQWFHGEAIPNMVATEDPNAILVAGDHCDWCPGRDTCPAFRAVYSGFDCNSEPANMSIPELVDMLERADIVEAYIERGREIALKRAEAGEKLVNSRGEQARKLVYKQAKRAMKDGAETAAEAEFGEFAYEMKLKSPAALEDMFGAKGKEFTTKWAYVPATGYTLAKMGDKRPEVKPLLSLVDDGALGLDSNF